jgi:hypothetical protein
LVSGENILNVAVRKVGPRANWTAARGLPRIESVLISVRHSSCRNASAARFLASGNAITGDTMMTRAVLGAAALAVTVLLVGMPDAGAQERTEVGRLTCRVGPGIGALVASRRRMTCRFDRGEDMRIENYTGTITRFGLDVGATAGGVLTWAVFLRTRRVSAATLAGHYVGVSGEASLGVGVGGKALIGGSRRSVVLQPFSLMGQVGINLALGVTGMTLRYNGAARNPA